VRIVGAFEEIGDLEQVGPHGNNSIAEQHFASAGRTARGERALRGPAQPLDELPAPAGADRPDLPSALVADPRGDVEL
jgi:hypothetical protein